MEERVIPAFVSPSRLGEFVLSPELWRQNSRGCTSSGAARASPSLLEVNW